MTTHLQIPRATMYPLFRYRDPEAAFAWLGEAFGLEPLDISRDEAGTPVHAELRLGGGVLMISPDDADRPVSGTQEIYVALDRDEVDAHHARAQAAGAAIVRPITEQPYGSRDYSAADLEGNIWHFGTYRPALAARTSAA